MSDNIKVVVKVRPLIPREVEDKLGYQWRVNNNTLYQIDQNGRDYGSCFTFDKVYDKDTKTIDVYNDIAKPIVEAATAGFNGTIFAYGQTSSGKTYTMSGTKDAPGIIPLAVLNLFDIIKNIPDRDFLVRVSYVEIYNETLTDLLDIKKTIKICETFQGVKVDATEKVATSPHEVLEVMRETIESREHIEGEEEVGSVNVSQLNLVDLAGSERSGQTGATGIRFKEGTHINKSLSALALVIKQLSEDPNKHVNYRDSKLTRILQNSLGGNAKTSIICAVTPASIEETISTLQFANRAKAIKNNPAVNAVATDVTMIQTLTKQLSALKTQLESKKNVEQDNCKLQKQIGSLQRLILNGFAQQRTDLSGARRKLIPPRRMTISTLHPIQEDSIPTIPNFCTPGLKYNPMSIARATDFVPIQSSSSLPSVSEEVRLVTPPPKDKKVNFSDEVIELDSDDDSSTDIQTCSPYHDCYQSSKTPPCILRKNAKQAEKSLKEIVEFTEREKIYGTKVEELLLKLENKTTKITQLEEQLTKLGTLSKGKDSEMEKLKSNFNKVQDEIKNVTAAKAELEIACKDYSTKLTDWEVSYETLKKKSKSREEELLSLLQENETKKKHEKIGKIASKAIGRELTNFMDLSRDISLVSSDNENSIINIDKSPLSQIQPLVIDLQNELTLREQTILELKTELHTHKLKIDSLEIINQEFQEMVSVCKEKLSIIENENSLHKSTIDNLNNIIENQKSVIDNLNADIVSYNSVIQELQIKVAKKEKLPQDITDSDIEAMIANEKMFIANNENMKNIIQSLKSVLNSRNDEIKKLKSSLEKEKSQLNLEEELENKKKEIFILIEEVECLKTKSSENVAVINKLQEEKICLLGIEQQLNDKITEIQKGKESLNEQISNHLHEILDLKDCKEKLNLDLADKEREISSIKEIHEKEIADMSQKITDLEKSIEANNEIIVSLQKNDNENQENLQKVKLNIEKLNKILKLFEGSILEVPEKMNNLVSALNTFSDSLTSLENLAADTLVQKTQLASLLEDRESEIKLLQTHMNDLSHTVDGFYEDYLNLTVISNRNELFNRELKESENDYERLKNKITNLINIIKTTQIYLNQTLQDKDKRLNELFLKFEVKEAELDKVVKCGQQIQDLTKKRDELLQNILEKATGLTVDCDIENSISCEFNSNPENTYEHIILTLDKIANHVSLLKSEREAGNSNIERILCDARNEIKQLTGENIKLILDISNLENSNDVLTSQIQRIQNDSKCLTKDLKDSHNLLEELQQNLTSKSIEIDSLETKAMEWKDKYKSLEVIMKEQIDLLEMENIELKSKCSELELQDQQKSTNVEKETTRKSSVYNDVHSPPSLLTICCNRIIDVISINEDDKTISSVSSTVDIKDTDCITTRCFHCTDLKEDLDVLKARNVQLKRRIEELENENEILVKEKGEVQKEVRLLIENTLELQKKVVNHRTNLSTLTATTYAENRSLSSQIKFLQHHHSRFHTVCQRDIPDFKKQLQDLLHLLRSECVGKLNEGFKRYSSLPNALEAVSLHSPFKNESTIDGDLLMLDTNVTLTTCDNTLTSHDQTCFDVTQVCTYHEVSCQTNTHEIFKSSLSYPQMKKETLDETKISEVLESLKIENDKLREVVDEYKKNKETKHLADAQSSPIKLLSNFNDSFNLNNNENKETCYNCKHKDQVRVLDEKYKEEIEIMANKLTDLESKKSDIEIKYQNLSLEVPSSEALVRKINTLQKDNIQKQNEIEKLSYSLNKKREELKTLQEENDQLSNQVMESISEVDDLKKEHNTLKDINNNLTDRFSQLEKEIEQLKCQNQFQTCTKCSLKDEIISTLENKLVNSHSKLDRSYSDSESSSRYNKICTLQNELHAGKEDCIELKEQVTTIKNQLERSDLSIVHAMDLDESIGDPHICSFNRDFDNVKPEVNKYMPDIPEERPLDNYTLDKVDCFNFYTEKTGNDKESLNPDTKILDVLKLLYDNIAHKHANEIENLMNKLRDIEKSKTEIQMQFTKANSELTKVITELNEKDSYLSTLANVVSEIRNNIVIIKEESSETVITNFIDKFLKKVDKEFGFTGTEIFDILIKHINDRHNEEINRLSIENEKINSTVKAMAKEVESLNNNLSTVKLQLTEKENEMDLLRRRNEKIHEISNAVTLDIVKKERELRDLVTKTYEQFLENEIILQNIDVTLPIMDIIKLVFENILNNCKHNKTKHLEKEKSILVLEVDKLKTIIIVKEKELQLLKADFEKIEDVNRNMTIDISDKDERLQRQISLHEDLTKNYQTKVHENNNYVRTIQTLTDEVSTLKKKISEKDSEIASLESKINTAIINKDNDEKLKELEQSLTILKQELDHLKSINEIILAEKETCTQDLEIANGVIKQNKIDFEKLTTDILVLKETVIESSKVTENLRIESKRLLDENILLQNHLQEKTKDCSRLEENIKKHEKTAEIQSGIIIRLKKQKENDDNICMEKENQIKELRQTSELLETQREELSNELKSSKEKIEELINCKQLLEVRISELESELEAKPRLSIDINADTSRRRRQSIYDSKRMFSDDMEEHNKMEAVFKSRATTGDMFADTDDSSDRSTPIRLSRGRDSLISSKNDQSSREEESRPGSVQAARRRRQSAHDLRRSVAHDNSSESSRNNSIESEMAQVRKQLTSCQQELEELRERYRELDEECETCAEYLRERDGQYSRVKKEKIALENTVADLKVKLRNSNPNYSQINAKISLVDASVNTDEDWSNLHSVVVDRMSFDAEVEKNKKLMKTIEELRFNKQELKKTIVKMQKALERNAKEFKEVETTKAELSSCKRELEELREKYKELDEECETCAEYLRERDEQCRKLKEAKTALEAKLQEYHDLSGLTHSVRKKRQTLHDQNRRSPSTLTDASTETNDDLLSYQVEKDESTQSATGDTKPKELKRLKMALEKLSQQKAALEHQLVAATANPLYVATGSAIIQNQQLSDVMKENQKLKKMNAKLVHICKKRGKSLTDSNRENEDPLNN